MITRRPRLGRRKPKVRKLHPQMLLMKSLAPGETLVVTDPELFAPTNRLVREAGRRARRYMVTQRQGAVLLVHCFDLLPPPS